MIIVNALLLALFSLAYGNPLIRDKHVHSRRDSPPRGFSLTGAPSPDTVLNLRIAVAQSNPTGLQQALYDVSTPSSPNYGKHLSKKEAAHFVAPTNETVAAMDTWLKANDISATTLTPAGDWYGFSIPVSKANNIFDANYRIYTHENTGRQIIHTLSYSIPQELLGHLKVVHPTKAFSSRNVDSPLVSSLSVKRHASFRNRPTYRTSTSSSIDAYCNSTITPTCLQSLYGIPTIPATEPSNTLGVTGFSYQYANETDLKRFLKAYRTDMSDTTTFSVQTLDVTQGPHINFETEASIDIQYTVGLATDVPVVFLSVGENNHDGNLDGFLDLADYLLNEDSPPSVITTSYGENEEIVERDMADNLCNAYAQLGARGVSILFSSGDGGVSGSQSANCTDFLVTFPSGCPYVTSVGATMGISPEKGAFFSGGGFSNYWSTPSYQSSAVSSYFSSLGDTNKGLYNSSGRGYPDVSTQGWNFEVVVNGEFTSESGTSCSSPTFASVVALLNDELLASGRSPLGFLNPWLYSTASGALNDVTSGNNPGCKTNGFPATTGWDPITGLGTPNYAKLKSAAGL